MSNTSPLLDQGAVQRLAAELSARDNWARSALLDVQRKRLDDLLTHAVSASPYYRDTIGTDVRRGASLTYLPILTKTTLMDQWDRIVTDPQVTLRDVENHLAGPRRSELFRDEYRVFATGGTTGERAIVAYDGAAWLDAVANIHRWFGTIGVRPDARVVGIGAPTALHVTNRAFAEVQAGHSGAPRLSVLTPVPELVETLNAYQPDMIVTYASFARRLIEEQESGRLRIQPRRIASTAEVLALDVREHLRATWDTQVSNCYGTTEAVLVGTECDSSGGIHIAEDMVVLEVVDEHNRPVPDGVPGAKVLLTNLFNRTLPLIRYELSDIATLETATCACGRPYARVTAIDGRREDYMVLRALAGGCIRVHAGRLRAPLAGVPGLRQYQLVPMKERLTLRVSVRSDADAGSARAAATEVVRTALREAGADVVVSTEVVDIIARAGTGAKEKLVAAASTV